MIGFVMGAIASAVRVVVASADALFGYVGLLGNFAATSGATSYTDVLGNVFTFNGGAAVTSLNQRSGGGNSVLFDGVDDYVTAAVNGKLPLYGDDFCIEAWIRPDSLPTAGNSAGIISHRETATYNFSWRCSLNGSPGGSLPAGTPSFSYSTDGSNVAATVNGPSAPAVGVWSHIAIVREADSVTVFLNGVPGIPVSVAGAFFSAPAANVPIVIGRVNSAATGGNFAGQIDGVRVTRKSPRYPLVFSAPTADYTTSTSGYSDAALILNANGTVGSTTITDSGPGAVACTASVATQISTTGAAFGSRSISFEATGGYLDVAASAGFLIGTGDFTIEFYIQTTRSPTSIPWHRLLCPRLSTNPATGGIQIAVVDPGSLVASGGSLALTTSNAGAVVVSTCQPVDDGVWHHVAFVRKDGVASAFLDGVLRQRAAFTDSITVFQTEGIRIGGRADNNASALFGGKIARLAIWRSARYSSSFTPGVGGPAESGAIDSFSGYANVAGMMNMTSTQGTAIFVDEGPRGRGFSANGTAAMSRVVYPAPVVLASLKLAGSSWISATSNISDFALGAGDFTAEVWFRSTATNSPVLLDFYGTAVANSWQIQATPTKVSFLTSSGSGSVVVTEGAATVMNGKWHHVAVCRSGTTIRLFVDGVMVSSVTDARNFSGVVTTFAVGAQVYTRNSSYDLVGNVGPWRVVPGVAVYTANFTPPAKFPTR